MHAMPRRASECQNSSRFSVGSVTGSARAASPACVGQGREHAVGSASSEIHRLASHVKPAVMPFLVCSLLLGVTRSVRVAALAPRR
jgi:hypothetical protein